MERRERGRKSQKSDGRELIALLERELKKKYEGYDNATLIVRELVKKARDGDKQVGMWVFDRLYGKPKESKGDVNEVITDLIDDADLTEFESADEAESEFLPETEGQL